MWQCVVKRAPQFYARFNSSSQPITLRNAKAGLGAISTAVGIGASLSQVIAGSIVHHFGSNAGFLFLGAVALAAFAILFFFMPETGAKQSLNPIERAPSL